jgi:murein DD-endopeptidase MepM/ murein hydrolase activator NlpD
MAKSFIRRVYEDVLSDEQRVLLNGLGDDYFNTIKSNIESAWKDIDGGTNFTESDLEEKFKQLQRDTLPTLGLTMGTFKAQIHISENYRFFRAPAIETAAKTVDGYGEVVGSILSTRERLRYEYGAKTRAVAMSLYGGVYGAVALAKTAAAVAKAVKVAGGIRAAVQVAMVGKTAAGFAASTGYGLIWAVVQYAVSEALRRAAQKFGEWAFENRASRLAIQSAAPQVMKPERILNDYATYRGTYLMGEGGTNVYRKLEDTILSEYLGLSPDMFLNDYSDAARTVEKMNTSAIINRSNYLGYAERSMQLSGLYGRDMTDTLSSMSRVNLGGEVSSATTLFQKFFSSMVSDGKLHMSQLALVDEMSSFAETYVVGGRLNLEDGASNLARTHAFINPMFGDRQTTATTETLVTGLDSVLEQGALGGSPHMAMIMARTGMTRGEALGGITSKPETLEKLLYGMYLELGIGDNSFDEEGNLNDSDMQRYIAYTQHGLGMDSATQRATLVAYRSFVKGARGEAVSTAYAEEFEKTAAAEYPEYSMVSLAKSWTKGSRALTDVVFSYADIMLEIDNSILQLSKNLAPVLLPEIRRSIELAEEKTSGYASSLRRAGSSGGRNIPATEAVAAITEAGVTGSFTIDDARFGGLSSQAQAFQRYLLGGLALNQEFRLTGVGGLLYASSDSRLRNRINYGTDVVIGGRGSESPIYFPFNEGTVVYVGFRTRSTGENTYGLSVVINLDNNHQVSFSHLSRAFVSEGDVLSRGDLIGNQGATGLVTGAHVDIEFRKNAEMRGNVMTGEIIYDPDIVARMFSPFLGEYSIGGRLGGSSTAPMNRGNVKDSQIIPDYVNIDLEMNGVKSDDFARYFQSSFMRA